LTFKIIVAIITARGMGKNLITTQLLFGLYPLCFLYLFCGQWLHIICISTTALGWNCLFTVHLKN
jgi:hypothetical protein